MCELLLNKGYDVHGWTRDSKGSGLSSLLRILKRKSRAARFVPSQIQLHQIDNLSSQEVEKFIHKYELDEVYNLAGQSSVAWSFEHPRETFDANFSTVQLLLEAIRTSNASSSIKFFQASTAAIFEASKETPQNEKTIASPLSPYALSKLAAHNLVIKYREDFGMFSCNGILYNHESPRRPNSFVTGKIVEAVARIALGQQCELQLGNIDVARDWGFAGDYVKAMWGMLQNDTPEDFIIATGQLRTLEDFLNIAFRTVGLDWQDYVTVDENIKRPVDPPQLVGDPALIRKKLHWRSMTTFEEMIESMVKQKLNDIRRE